jgi:predicted nucleic acid-binding protein
VILVDANILLDIFTRDPVWRGWSMTRMDEAARDGPLLINDVIYAEASVGFLSSEDFDAALAKARVTVASIPRLALFHAGKAFTEYRRRGGVRTGVLPDFFIGAHAMVEQLPVLTRDERRFRRYFPTVELISPSAK